MPSAVLAALLAGGAAFWSWQAAFGVAVGWLAAAGPMWLNERFVPGILSPDAPKKVVQIKLLAYALLKWPILALVIFFTVRLGFSASLGCAVGLVSVYLALAAGAFRSLRSRD